MKKLKIIIPVIVILLIAIVAVVVVASGKMAISDKSKVSMGLSKAYNSLEEVSSQLDNIAEYKLDSQYTKKPMEAEVGLSMNAEIKNLKDLVGDKETADSIESIIKSLSNVNLTTKISMDASEKKSMVSATLKAKDIIGTISGEVIDTPEKVTLRSKELSDKYLTVDKKEAMELDPTIEELLNKIEELYERDWSKLELTDDEINHFKETYKDIFENNLKDDMMKSEKAEIEVNGAKKSCTKEVLTFDSENLKALLTEYITTFENDKDGRKIIEDKFNVIYGEELAQDLLDGLDESIDDIKSELDDLENVEFKFNTYCSLFDVYAVEYIFTIDGDELSIKEIFNSDNTEFIISSEDTQYGKFTMTKENDGIKVEGTIEVDEDSAEISIIINPTKFDFVISAKQDGEDVGKFEMAVDMDVKTNTETEVEQDCKITISVDVPYDESNISGSITFNVTEKIKEVDSVTLPKVKDSVNLLDEEELAEYQEEAAEKLEEYMETLEDSEVYQTIQSLSSLTNLFSSSSFDDDWTLENSDVELDEEELKNNIKDWYEYNIEADDEMTLTEVVEDNMIGDYDFSNLVTTVVYTSWEEGATEDKGYVKVKVTSDYDEEDSYTFVVDIKTGKVYSEDDFKEKVNWNEYE